jgi:cytidine deaminase
MIDKDLLKHLKETRDNALAKYSHFKVGAVLITKDGKKFSGFNIESSSYGLTICAERVALFKALSEGERKFKEIYIICQNDEFCSPCGACRQVLMDYAPNLKVILVNDNGDNKIYKINELLPEAFTEDRLTKKKPKK